MAAEGVSEETVDYGLAPNQLLTISPCTRTMEHMNMRRKRCPYCKSLNTAEVIIGKSGGGISGDCRVCDDCDRSFDHQNLIDGKWVKQPNDGIVVRTV